jgi:copper chaperone CopZ
MGFFKKEKSRQIEITIEDMVCGHCEIHVQRAINKLKGVKKSKVSKSKKNAIITLKKGAEVDIDEILKAVNATGYKASIKSQSKMV